MIIPQTLRMLAFCALLHITTTVYSQNRAEAQKVINDLCSDEMAGRGYISDGDKKAADYIASKYKSVGLSAWSSDYFQEFSLNVNTITKARLDIDGKLLIPGYDYLVSPASGSVSLNNPIFYVSKKLLQSSKVHKKVRKAHKKGYTPVITTFNAKDKTIAENVEMIKKCNQGKTMVFLKNHLTWSVSRNQVVGAEIWLLDTLFDRYSKRIEVEIEATLRENYTSQNVAGFVKGTEYPDSVVIFCGHYDHLGQMGDAIFYGANDNASGISILLDMAAYFANNPQKYTIAFIAFGGEEAGLVGSYNYVKSPLIPLTKTKFVFNMDLMGSGEQGATIVNGSVYKKQFQELVRINDSNGYLPKIKSRGKAANSDHYFFSEAGVPSFFIYLMGDYKHYHIPADNAKNLVLGPYYDKSFQLIRDFIIYLSK